MFETFNPPVPINRFTNKRAPASARTCSDLSPNGGHLCTRDPNHVGPHVCHLGTGEALAGWLVGPGATGIPPVNYTTSDPMYPSCPTCGVRSVPCRCPLPATQASTAQPAPTYPTLPQGAAAPAPAPRAPLPGGVYSSPGRTAQAGVAIIGGVDEWDLLEDATGSDYKRLPYMSDTGSFIYPKGH